MPTENALNPGKGKAFQKRAAELLSAYFGVEFQLDYPIPIGSPPKEHKFDLVSSDLKYMGECKNYSWTESGNVPSAKMGFINEAAFYLSFLPAKSIRFIVMRRDAHKKTGESLASYYYRTNKHLLGGVFIIEIDPQNSKIKEIGRS